jgi:hypothetical protein
MARRLWWAGLGAAGALWGRRALARRFGQEPALEATRDLVGTLGRRAGGALGLGVRVLARRADEARRAGRQRAERTRLELTRRYLEPASHRDVPARFARRTRPTLGPLASPPVEPSPQGGTPRRRRGAWPVGGRAER